MIGLLVFLAAMLVLPIVLARWLLARHTRIASWVIVGMSAAVVPIALMIPVVIVVISTRNSTPKQCGVDACGMNIVASLMATGVIVSLFACSVVVNAAFVYRVRRRAPSSHYDVFE